MSAAEKFVTRPPGRMESRPSSRALTRPFCALQELDPEEHAMCDLLEDEEKKLLARTDPETFKLQVEFMHAHGVPKGHITMFSNACTIGPMGGSSGRTGARGK
jgi:hypothetical protein